MFGNTEETLWVEKYRPTSLEGYVGNPHIIGNAKTWIASDDVPHILLYGPAGTGKTTLAKIISNSLNASVLYMNASDENDVDTFRNKVKGFAASAGFNKWKIVLLDEADYLTPQSMAILRNMMEEFATTTRFILTCNFREKIIDPIISRCQTFQVIPPDKKEVARRVVHILDSEKIKYDLKDIGTAVLMGFPDMRRVISICQQHIVDGKLTINSALSGTVTYMEEIVELLSSRKDPKGTFGKIRQMIADSSVRDFTALYQHLYQNIDTFASGAIGDTILILAEYQYKDSAVVDKEINVMAMFYTLIQRLFS